MGTYERVADLPLTIDDYALEGLVAGRLERLRAAQHGHPPARRRRGGRRRGRHLRAPTSTGSRSRARAGARARRRRGRSTRFSEHLGALDLFPACAPGMRRLPPLPALGATSRAALDLALRQAGASLHEVARPRAAARALRRLLAAWASRRRSSRSTRRLARYPGLRFKLDATPDWDDELIAALRRRPAPSTRSTSRAPTRARRSTSPTDPALYRRVAEAFPDAWLEDPDLEDEERPRGARPVRGPDHLGRADPLRRRTSSPRRVIPRTVNLKPSRFGCVKALFEAYDFCAAARDGRLRRRPVRARRRAAGRSSCSPRCSTPTRPNDIAPGGYDALDPEPGLPQSPLDPAPERHRLPPPHHRLDSKPCRPSSARSASSQKSALGAMQQLETRSDEELHAETRFRAAAQAILGRPRRRADGRRALARALPRRDRGRPPAGAPAAAAHGRGVAGARRAPRRTT